MELDIQQHPIEMILIYVFLVISLGLHEAAHAKVAGLFGDTTPATDGVDTWNPISHIRRSIFSCVIVPAITWFMGRFFMGGAFVRINPAKMKPRRLGYATSVASGPFMNLAIAILCALLGVLFTIITKKQLSSAVLIMLYVGSFNFFIFVFNLVPIPPLDGSVIIRTLLPITERFFRMMQSFPLLLLFIIGVQFEAVGTVIFFPVRLYMNVVSGLLVSIPV